MVSTTGILRNAPAPQPPRGHLGATIAAAVAASMVVGALAGAAVTTRASAPPVVAPSTTTIALDWSGPGTIDYAAVLSNARLAPARAVDWQGDELGRPGAGAVYLDARAAIVTVRGTVSGETYCRIVVNGIEVDRQHATEQYSATCVWVR